MDPKGMKSWLEMFHAEICNEKCWLINHEPEMTPGGFEKKKMNLMDLQDVFWRCRNMWWWRGGGKLGRWFQCFFNFQLHLG